MKSVVDNFYHNSLTPPVNLHCKMVTYMYFRVAISLWLFHSSFGCITPDVDPVECNGNEAKCTSTIPAVRQAAKRACPVLCKSCKDDENNTNKTRPIAATIAETTATTQVDCPPARAHTHLTSAHAYTREKNSRPLFTCTLNKC